MMPTHLVLHSTADFYTNFSSSNCRCLLLADQGEWHMLRDDRARTGVLTTGHSEETLPPENTILKYSDGG